MVISQKIFKPYDIRGVYPTELNEEAAYAIGRAFARRAGADRVVVGTDMRTSGPQLKKELVRGITDEGVNVVDIGLVPIDAVYASVGIFKYPAAIMITASHNPKEYNGFKMVLSEMRWVRGEELLSDVMNLSGKVAEKKGTVESFDLYPQYLAHVLSFVDVKKIKPFTVVIDAGNGMAGTVVPLLEAHLPVKVIRLNFELDGNFPAHPSNPLLPESQIGITNAVREHKADFGVIFDGDTDRLFFIDEKGQFIRADYSLLILAKEFLRREPGKGIVYNVICSKIVPQKIAEWGGKPLRSKVGYVNISTVMRENDGIMGGELSAHYSFRDNAGADSGFIAWLILMQLISEDGRKLSEIVSEFQQYVKSDEINIEVTDRDAVVAAVKKHFTDGKQNELDGLTVEYADWWFNVRASNTEPLLRVTIEAGDAKTLGEKQQGILDVIKNFSNA